MNPYALIIDDFLPDFEAVRALADRADYRTVRNEADGVEYPFICEVPPDVAQSVGNRIANIMGQPILARHVFFRASPAGVHVPNQVHNDLSMGQYSLMLYMNRPEDCTGGTSFLRHREHGFERSPRNDAELAAAQRDSNEPDRWTVTMTCPMATNRAVIFPAELMHRAEPVGGFGDGKTARVVLTAFFDPIAAHVATARPELRAMH